MTQNQPIEQEWTQDDPIEWEWRDGDWILRQGKRVIVMSETDARKFAELVDEKAYWDSQNGDLWREKYP